MSSSSISTNRWVFQGHVTWHSGELLSLFLRLYDSEQQYEVKLGKQKVAYELGLEKKGFKRRHVTTDRRIKILTKHNYQPRQAIMSRHLKEEMKGDR